MTMTGGEVPVLIVDDQAPFRRAALSVVGMTPGFEVVGETGTGEEAVQLVGRLAPRLVLMDINMPGIDGIEASRRITASHPDVKVMLLSTYQLADVPADARTSGAEAYVHKEDFGPQLLRDVWTGRVANLSDGGPVSG